MWSVIVVDVLVTLVGIYYWEERVRIKEISKILIVIAAGKKIDIKITNYIAVEFGLRNYI